jgi:two-component system nitrogen regulation response regulator NtrX
MQEVAKRLKQAIASSDGVLLCGEPGTGREYFARVIHLATNGDRDVSVERLLDESLQPLADAHPFVVIDCAAPENLERRLFGGRFAAPDAASDGLDRIGAGCAVHRALGGTLFIRQVPDMPAGLQVRLARLLRDGEVWVHPNQGGSAEHTFVVIRPIATSDRSEDDERIVPELLKRLDHMRIQTPPLRERREDIPALVARLLVEIAAEQGVSPKRASRQATALLSALPWRGNARELRTFLAALMLKVRGPVIKQVDVLENVQLDGGPTTFVYGGTLKEARGRFERDYVTSVLEQHRGRMAEAAKALGIQRTNLYRKVRQLSVARRPPKRSDP